jgi:hypothetical protein
MIADLTGVLGAVYGPLCRQSRDRAISWTFHIDISARRQPPLLQPARDLLQHCGFERRVEKDDVEGLCWAQQEALRILDHDGRVAAAEAFQRLLEMTPYLRLAVDESHLRGTARQRLEAERAAAREQIQTTRADDRLLQPIEQRFAHAVG